jgi:hypothetical protein
MPEAAWQNLYHNIDMKAARYRFSRQPVYNIPSGSITVNSTSANNFQIKIPAQTVFNLGRSLIPYQYTLPAGTATQYVCSYEDGVNLFRNIQFTDGSQNMCDLNNADVFLHNMRPFNTQVKDLLTRDPLDEFYFSNESIGTGLTDNNFTFSTDNMLTTAAVQASNPNPGTLNSATVNILENEKFKLGAVGQSLTIARMFKLGDLKDTIFGADQDLCFNCDTYINIVPQYGARMFFYTTNPASPQNGAAAVSTGTVTLSNLYLQLAVQENEDIRQNVKRALASSAISLSIPYTISNRYSSPGNASSFSASLTLPKQGRLLKRNMITVGYGSEYAAAYAWLHNNRNGSCVSQIYTSLDGRFLTDAPVNCYNPNDPINPLLSATTNLWSSVTDLAMDWREMQKWTRGTAILNYQMFQTMWAYFDSWGEIYNDSPDRYFYPSQCINDGLDVLLSGDHSYTITCNCPAVNYASNVYNSVGVLFYIFSTYLKTLQITPGGIILSN